MKLNKKFIIVFLALFYLLVIQRIITLYLFPVLGVTPINQLQQETISYLMIIKIVLLLIALSMISVFMVLKNNSGTNDPLFLKKCFLS